MVTDNNFCDRLHTVLTLIACIMWFPVVVVCVWSLPLLCRMFWLAW